MDTENLLPQKEAPPAYQPTAPPHQIQPSAPQDHFQGYTSQAPPQTNQPSQQPYYQYQAYQNQPPYQQPQQTIITGFIWCLAFTSFFCCTLFGILALIFAFAGYDNEKRLEYERARQNAKLVKVFGGLAIVIGSGAIGFSLVMVTISLVAGGGAS